jgi:hypothetical protein
LWHALHQALGNQGAQRLLNTGVAKPSPGRQEASDTPPLVHQVLGSPGQPLDRSTREFMEPRLGADFREVRVHTDAEAAASARLVGAQAYTVGQDVVFDAGKFSPATTAGQALLAHELVHVKQDPGGGKGSTSDVAIGSSSDPAESEADAAAAGALRGEAVRSTLRANAPAAGTAILRRAEATPGTVATDREAQIEADVQRIIAILDEWHYSDADEQQVIDILTKWALAGTGAERLTPLDRVFSRLLQRTTTVGVMGQTTNYYSLIFNHFDRAQEVRNLRDRYARTFQSETGMKEISILDQDWMQTAGEAWTPVKQRLYDALISGMRGAQAAALNRLRAMIADWPPVAQVAGAVMIDQIEIASDTLISLVLALVGLVVGFVSGIAKLVWGLLQFLWGVLDTFMLSILANFSDTRREQLDQRITAIREGVANLIPALKVLKDRWLDEFSKASPDRQTIMIGELTGEIEAILASFLAGGEAAGSLPKLPVTIPVPAPALVTAGVRTVSGAGAITIDLAAAGPPVIAGTAVGTTAMAVSQEAKTGGPPEQGAKEPLGGSAKPKEPAKAPLPSERKFQPDEWEKLTPKEQQDFAKQWMDEHGVEKADPGPVPKTTEAEKLVVGDPKPPQGFEDMPEFNPKTPKQAGVGLAEDHHIATKYRQANQSIFKKLGMSVDDDLNLIVDFEDHGQLRGWYDWNARGYKKYFMKGHHREYNEWVTKLLKEASPDGIAPDKALERVKKVLETLKPLVKENPELLSHGPGISPKFRDLKIPFD